MSRRRPTRSAARRHPSIGVAALLVVVVALPLAVGCQALASSSSPGTVLRGVVTGAPGQSDGTVPDGTTVFDDVPAVTRLRPALLAALRRAATEADDAGVGFVVNSGWRSRADQERLLREATSRYGSAAEAARWVAPPDTSAHVTGDAVDLGPAAAGWLGEHGAAYGLCRVYGNEPWHYELRLSAPSAGCPETYADATHDPRLRP